MNKYMQVFNSVFKYKYVFLNLEPFFKSFILNGIREDYFLRNVVSLRTNESCDTDICNEIGIKSLRLNTTFEIFS